MIRLRVQADEFKRFITGECASLLDLGRQRVKPPPDLHAKPPSDVHAKRLQALPSKGHGLPSCPSDPLSERPRIDDDEYVRSKLAAHEKRLVALGERLEAAMGKRRLAARRQARLVALGRQQGEQRRQCLAALHDLSRTPIPLAVKDGAPGGRLGGARIVPLYQTERLLVMLERRQKARAGREPSAEALGEEAGVSLGASPSRRITSQVKSSCQITSQAFKEEAEAVRGRASVAEASGGAAFAASACTALIEMGEHDLAGDLAARTGTAGEWNQGMAVLLQGLTSPRRPGARSHSPRPSTHLSTVLSPPTKTEFDGIIARGCKRGVSGGGDLGGDCSPYGLPVTVISRETQAALITALERLEFGVLQNVIRTATPHTATRLQRPMAPSLSLPALPTRQPGGQRANQSHTRPNLMPKQDREWERKCGERRAALAELLCEAQRRRVCGALERYQHQKVVTLGE